MQAYRRTVIAVWILSLIVFGAYSQLQAIAASAWLPFLAGFWIESALYLCLAFPEVRDRAQHWTRLPVWMWSLAVLPFLVYTIGVGRFAWQSALVVAGLSLAVVVWARLAPKNDWFDAAFLALVAAAILARSLRDAYPVVDRRVPAELLGQLMWLRHSMLAMMLLRRKDVEGFGFWPNLADWRVGGLMFAAFFPIGFGVAAWSGFLQWNPRTSAMLQAPLLFLGILWVVALSEEYFFRGILQPLLSRVWRSDRLGQIGTAVLFGMVHLPFRGFPNWRFALLAALAGWFYGEAYRRARSVRAAMVTHSLVVVSWRTLFT